jgi:hypothetical protein
VSGGAAGAAHALTLLVARLSSSSLSLGDRREFRQLIREADEAHWRYSLVNFLCLIQILEKIFGYFFEIILHFIYKFYQPGWIYLHDLMTNVTVFLANYQGFKSLAKGM